MTTLDWTEFGSRLSGTVAGLADRCYLIVPAPDQGGYVQFAAMADALAAEASGPEYTSGAATHEPDDPQMLAAGWVAPDRAQPNWSCRLPQPALTSEYADLAHRCVVALRDVFGAVSPDVLTYQAWREPETQPPGVTWPPERFERLDPGENPLPLPHLGLRPEPAG